MLTRVSADEDIYIHQLLSYTTTMRYMAIQKFGINILNLDALVVRKLIIMLNVINRYQTDKQTREDTATRLRSLGGSASKQTGANIPMLSSPGR